MLASLVVSKEFRGKLFQIVVTNIYIITMYWVAVKKQNLFGSHMLVDNVYCQTKMAS